MIFPQEKVEDLAAVVLNVPFSIIASQNGLRSLGRTVDLLGPYQATGAFVMRNWAKANGPLLERYLAAYVESLRWAMEPANRAESLALLTERLKLAPDVAEKSYDAMREPKFGLATDARFDVGKGIDDIEPAVAHRGTKARHVTTRLDDPVGVGDEQIAGRYRDDLTAGGAGRQGQARASPHALRFRLLCRCDAGEHS